MRYRAESIRRICVCFLSTKNLQSTRLTSGGWAGVCMLRIAKSVDKKIYIIRGREGYVVEHQSPPAESVRARLRLEIESIFYSRVSCVDGRFVRVQYKSQGIR